MLNRNNIISDEEQKYTDKLNSAVENFLSADDLRVVLIAGGSCSGKTTTTKRLSETFASHGRNAFIISLDDFYRSRDESVYLPDGRRDIESVKSLRTDILREKLVSLLDNKKTSLPVFDFRISKRLDDNFDIRLDKNDILLIEGLHALNPMLLGDFFDDYPSKKLYLYCDAGDNSDRRIIRRIVRDQRHRGHSAEETFFFWDNVRANELDAIIPYRATADAEINTFIAYEPLILDPDAAELLSAIEPQSPHYNESQDLLKKLRVGETLSSDLVPENSLLREFI